MLETKDKEKKRYEQVKTAETARPPRLKIERRRDGRLWAEHNGTWVPLRVYSCFPWSHPSRYVSLRDEEENEIVLIKDLSKLEPQSRRLIEEALAEAGFVMEIEAVEARQEEFEIRTWQVRTRQGRRKFQTKRDDWPRVLPRGGLLIRDVAGDLFYIRDPYALDADSKRFLAPFLD